MGLIFKVFHHSCPALYKALKPMLYVKYLRSTMNLNFISLHLSTRLNDLLDQVQNACWIKLKYSYVCSSSLNKQAVNEIQ